MSLATLPSPDVVLLVEDQGLITFGLTYALRHAGYDVVACSAPEPDEVVRLAHRHAPALAMIDLQLGGAGSDGLELIRPLRAIGVPTVVLTGDNDRSVHGECLENGAVGVVSKSQTVDHVIGRIRAALACEPVNSARERQDMLTAARARRADEQRRLAPFGALSRREAEVLDHLAQGSTAEAIATQLFLSTSTVRMHIQHILRKLDVNSQLAAVAKATAAGWSLHEQR